jgi:hypothetical protein
MKNDCPAFPWDHANESRSGMTLRDYFAAQVLIGAYGNTDVLTKLPKGQEGEFLARIAYEQADAMLKVRSQ